MEYNNSNKKDPLFCLLPLVFFQTMEIHSESASLSYIDYLLTFLSFVCQIRFVMFSGLDPDSLLINHLRQLKP